VSLAGIVVSQVLQCEQRSARLYGISQALNTLLMDPEIEWLTQRITLFRTHIQELQEHFRRQQKKQHVLKQQHQTKQKAIKNDPGWQAALATEYVRQVTELAISFSTERKTILDRQLQAELAQHQRIRLEREQSANR
jgi:hypothetical protein